MIVDKENILDCSFGTSTQSKQSRVYDSFSVFPWLSYGDIQNWIQSFLIQMKDSSHTQVIKVLSTRQSAAKNAHTRSRHKLYLQLSSSKEQFWVSRGNLLKSMKHIAETVILQKGKEKQAVNEKFHAFSGLCRHLIEIPKQPG